MNVELKEMRLRNFKGVQDRTFKFTHDTVVKGTNGTGKSTLFDAFSFCLFGKDSSGRADLECCKRRDSSGRIIHELEYGVELVLDIDGVEKRFERVVTEKWTKPRGASSKALSGNECAYYLDRVRCSTKKEYDTAVSQITSEEVLRMMTDVYYFIHQKDDAKKAILLKLAYGTQDESKADELATNEVLLEHREFKDFVDFLNGEKLKDFNTKIGQKIRAVKAEIDEIPAKISAKKETMPPEEDWDGINSLIEANREELENVNRQIANENDRNVAANEKANSIRTQISDLEYRLTKRSNEIKTEIANKKAVAQNKLSVINSEISQINNGIVKNREKIAEDRTMVEKLECQLQDMRAKYRDIIEGTYQYTDEELRCPTCGRLYDLDNLKEQKVAENKAQGKSIRSDYDRYNQEICLLERRTSDLEDEIAKLNEQKQSIDPVQANPDDAIKSDTVCNQLEQQISSLREQLANSAWHNAIANATLIGTKKEIEAKVQNLQCKLGVREVISRTEAQIKALEDKLAALNNELGSLERRQDEAKAFQMAKDRQLINKVNSKFTIVTWDFVTEQYNGNDKIACNCYIDGMPYFEKNRAGQVNAGLDIINAIAKEENLRLPIFIDNAESVVEYIGTESQKILLKVDASCKELKFE